MDKLIKIYRSFTKRERILIYIFIVLVLELLLYLSLFSKEVEKIGRLKSEKISLVNDIETKEEVLKSIASLKSENKSLSSNILKIEKESISKLKNFKEEFSDAKISTDENNMHVEFLLDKNKIERLKNILNYGVFENIKINLIDNGKYQVIYNFKNNLDNNVIIPTNEKLDKSLNLNKEYFKSKVSNFSKISKDELNKKYEVKLNDNKEDDKKKELDKKIEKDIKKIEKDIKDTNIQDKNVEDVYIPIDFNYDNFIAFSPDGDEVELIKDEDRLLIYYDLKKDDDMFIFFNEIIDAKSFLFEVELTREINGKLGLLSIDPLFYDKGLSLENINQIEFKDVSGAKALVYRPIEDEKGLLIISNFRGTR